MWNPFRWFVLLIDALVRRASGIRPLADRPDCLFRIAVRPSPDDYRFADGVRVRRGDPVVELHFWNEHLPRMGPNGPDLRWARAFYTQFRTSLSLLAEQMTRDPRLKQAVAAHGRLFLHLDRRDPAALLVRKLGFEIQRVPDPVTPWQRVQRFFVTLYAGWLIWAYNPTDLKSHAIWSKDLVDVWISRPRLLTLHAPSPDPTPPSSPL